MYSAAAFVRSGVADPFSGVRDDDGLPGADFERSVLVFDAQGSLENDGELVERGSLAGLAPSGGLRMWRCWRRRFWELTRPTYSSINLGCCLLIECAWGAGSGWAWGGRSQFLLLRVAMSILRSAMRDKFLSEGRV